MNKFISILALFFISIFAFNNVNAISLTDVNWLDENGNVVEGDTYTINDGGNARFQMWASTSPSLLPIVVDIDIWKNNVFYSNFIDETSNNLDVFRIYDVYSNNYDGSGVYEFNIESSDDLSTQTKTLYLNVLSTNTAPYFDALPDLYLEENSGFNDNLLALASYAHDNENDPLTFTILSESNTNVVDCNIDANNYFLDCNVVNNLVGESVVTIEVSDGEFSDTESLTVYVQEISENTEPTISIVKPVTNEIIKGIYNILWTAGDPDQLANTLDVKIEYQPYEEILNDEWTVLENSINNNDGVFSWNTNNIDDDKYILRVTARDDQNTASYDTVIFYVNNQIINHPPVVNIDYPINTEVISGLYNTEWTALDIDQLYSTLNVKVEYKEDNWISFLSSWITIFESSNNPGSYLWNTFPIDDGNYKLRVTVTDDTNLIDQDEVLFSIDNEISINHDPEITSSPVTTAYANQLYSYDVNAIDIDNDQLTYLFNSNVPDGMTIDPNTGFINWMPNQESSYPVEVKVIDNQGGQDTQQFTINVYSQEEPQPQIEKKEKHKFLISNVIAKKKGNYLDIYVDIDNKGNKKENVNLKAVILKTGESVHDDFNLFVYDGYWRQLRFNKPANGNYVIKIEAESSHYNDVRYIYVRV